MKSLCRSGGFRGVANGLAWFRRYSQAVRDVRITVQGIDGSMRRAETNSFGYYRVTGLEAGSSYIVSVSARRHTFATASVMVNLSDNVDGLNFRSSP